MSHPTYVIFDLDNCLADDSARIPLIDWSAANPEDRYRAYHEACANDPCPVTSRALFARWTAGGSRVPIFLTARPVSVHVLTVEWLANHLHVHNPILLMRNIGDHRPSRELKRAQLHDLRDHYDVVFDWIAMAFDDRPEIVEMYREEGIAATCVRIHDLCAYTPRAEELRVDANAFINAFAASPSVAANPEAKRRAPDFLEAGAATFRERNAIYGDNYLEAGDALSMMFPRGLKVETASEWTRLSLFMHCFDKLSRYAKNLDGDKAGHRDSAHDLMVYAAMLEEVTP